VPRAPLRLTLPFLSALACAGAPPLPAGVSAAPALGDPLALLVTKLSHAEGAPADVAVRELRIIAVDREPWQTLDAEAAAAHPGELGVVTGRRCTWREGLERHQVDRASWFLLSEGALRAFDHQGFGAECASRPGFEPANAGQVPLERTLMRYLSQRWPVAEIPADQRLARGLALLDRGRTEDAGYELQALDRRIEEVSRRQNDVDTPDEAERRSLREEEARLRPERAQLYHALRAARGGEEPLP
jgi:hypothetical protein